MPMQTRCGHRPAQFTTRSGKTACATSKRSRLGYSAWQLRRARTGSATAATPYKQAADLHRPIEETTMADAIAASLHYLSIFVLFALLTCEHILFRNDIDHTTARRLLRIDMAYGMAAGLVLVTGAVRVVWYGKGLDYYLHNWIFHAKVSLFILVGLLSILPTLTFFNWRNELLAGKAPSISPAQARRTIMVIRLELLILVCLPFLASLMARGAGFFV